MIGSARRPLLPRIDPALGPRLLALPCDLVWATTWLDEANKAVGPRLGLPELPVLDWPDGPDGPSGLHWKTRAIVEWAGGRDLVWADDEIADADREWIAAHHPGRALLRRVDPRRGLTDADFTAIEMWCQGRTGRP
ncbi:HAD domain-containing protein [Actinomycetota bacterium Odt1-20B]